MNIDWVAIAWQGLGVIALLLAGGFFIRYRIDRDQRKLMFAVAFLVSIISYGYIIFGYQPRIQTINALSLFLGNLYYWSGLPVMAAIFVVVNTSLMGKRHFSWLFAGFWIFCGFSLLMLPLVVFVPELSAVFRYVLGLETISVLIYLIIKNRNIVDVLSLITNCCLRGIRCHASEGDSTTRRHFSSHRRRVVAVNLSSDSRGNRDRRTRDDVSVLIAGKTQSCRKSV